MKGLIKLLSKGVLGLVFFFVSCNSEVCERLSCGSNSQCNEGVCECVFGYEQDYAGKCDVAIRDKFLGDFTAIDYCSDGSGRRSSYTITIKKSESDIAKFFIYNFFDKGNHLEAEIESSTKFTIPTQTFRNETYYGNGSIINAGVDKRITVSYNIESLYKSKNSCTSDLVSN